jgi:hypothetical protein
MYYFFKLHFNIIFPKRQDLQSGLFLSFTTRILYEFLPFLMRATRSAHLILRDLITDNGLLIAAIAGSNPADGKNVLVLCV